MRIGLVCPYDLGRPGGVQQQVLDIGRLLTGAGEKVTIIGPGAAAVADEAYRVAEVGRVRPVRANGSVVPLALGFNIARLIRDAAADLDVLHVHEPLMPVVGPAALRAGRPVVATFHASPPAWMGMAYRAGPPRWLRGRWFKQAVLTAVSAEAARGPRSLGPVEVIPNGVDIGSYVQQVPKVPGRVAFLGRDEPRKGLSVLKEAWPLVLSSHPGAVLAVIGADSPDLDSHRVANVEYMGRVDDADKRRLLGQASIMVAPNLGGESFGLVVVEAMAAGCAVVASDIPAFRAVAGAAAELVPPGNPADLANAIARLMSDPSAIEALARAGQNRAKDFDWSRVLPQYRACYQRAIDEGAR
ncbi:MAG TPA: glycosyltransferase family 4 protein [Acidimicrobiia bacterium]|nr:glycosyltransferase family 4 protein [Acidimicrobiia bacterium]